MNDVKVSIIEVINDLWDDLSASQKFVSCSLVLLIIVAVAGSWINTFKTWKEIRGYENAAIEAKRDKEDALAAAAKVVSEIKIREEELAKVEVKRDAKKQEVKRAGEVVSSDRAEYDRAVRERRRDAPSTDQLCRELAALGYPCQPR